MEPMTLEQIAAELAKKHRHIGVEGIPSVIGWLKLLVARPDLLHQLAMHTEQAVKDAGLIKPLQASSADYIQVGPYQQPCIDRDGVLMGVTSGPSPEIRYFDRRTRREVYNAHGGDPNDEGSMLHRRMVPPRP